jgi:diguanylate cyclase (GGDEF)-like protein/PAS domain S-box-containing protein
MSSRKNSNLSDPEVLVDLVNRISEGVYITNAEGKIIDANPALLGILGLPTLKALQNYAVTELINPAQREEELVQLHRDGFVNDFELIVHRPDGEIRIVLDSAYVARDPINGEATYRGMMRDITPRKKLESQLQEQSVRDPLTGCFNRRHLSDFEKKLGDKPWGCIVLDIDHFKHYNDTYGHQAGDDALAQMTRFMLRHLRADASVVRLGGDEFLMLLPRVDAARTEQTANRIQEAAAKEAPTPFSMGYAAREGKETLEQTIHRADKNLYAVRTFRRAPNQERRKPRH